MIVSVRVTQKFANNKRICDKNRILTKTYARKKRICDFKRTRHKKRRRESKNVCFTNYSSMIKNVRVTKMTRYKKLLFGKNVRMS